MELMPHSNESNPINWELVFSATTLLQINKQHGDMANYIEQASPDSAALAQVRLAQYAAAVSEANRALKEVLRLQEQNIELAYLNAPHEGLDEELKSLGL